VVLPMLDLQHVKTWFVSEYYKAAAPQKTQAKG